MCAAPLRTRAPQGVQSIHWCFTIPDIDQSIDYTKCVDAPLPLFDVEKMDYLVYQIEKAPETGRLHVQGYLSLNKKLRLTGVKKIHASAHWEKTRGTPKQASDYCKKPESRVAGPWEWGICPDDRGKKSATALAIEAIQAGKPLSVVAGENPLAWVRSSRGLTSLHMMLQPDPDYRIVTTTILYGDTRTGKTRRAMASLCADGRRPFVMPLSSGFWFDSYEGQDTIVIDDFYGQIKFSDMLRLLDGHPLLVPVKGGFTRALWTKIFITSNAHPDLWWHASVDRIPIGSMEAMKARFTEIVNMRVGDVSANADVVVDPINQ